VKHHPSHRQGFTLAEVAVTVLIVGTMLIYLLQGLNTTKMLAAHTRNTKLARELAVYKLGQIGSGLYQEDIDRGIGGTFSEEGYPEFTYEVVVGDNTFLDQPADDRLQRPFDSWAPRDSSSSSSRSSETDKEEDEEVEEPFEKVRIRITFPKLKEFKNELTMERWFPWTQVYGASEEETDAGNSSANAGSGTGTGSGGSGGSGGSTKP
jgi:prepilin-type N-terminal cleavage/methylation domain-containing protein